MPNETVVGIHKEDNKLFGLFLSPGNFQQPITIHMEMYVIYNSQDTEAMNFSIRYFDESKKTPLDAPIRIGKQGDEYFIEPSTNPEIQKAIDSLPESKPHKADFV